MPIWLTAVLGFARKLWAIKWVRYAAITVGAFMALKAWGHWRYYSGYSAGKAEIEEQVAANVARLAVNNSLLLLKHAAEMKAARDRWESQTRSLTDYVRTNPALPECRLADDGFDLLRNLYPAQGGVRPGGNGAGKKPGAASKR